MSIGSFSSWFFGTWLFGTGLFGTGLFGTGLFGTRRKSRVLVALALGTCGCVTPGPVAEPATPASAPAQPPPAEPQKPLTVLPSPALARAESEGVVIADIAEAALPSVVNVSSTRMRRMRDPFHWFFGPQGGPGIERREQGLGSGVIVSTDGVVLTNNHVVADAEEINITTHDGREFAAKVLGTDPKSDLAVLKIKGDASGLAPIRFGDSSNLRLGDVVLAIGNPFGIGQTVTMGIVSAKGRADVGIVDYEDFIQTDAAINPGNSGGALINMRGELVGINTAILSRSGGYQGIGFAIPSNMAQPIMQSLETTGHVVRGWLGVAIQQVDQDLANALKLPSIEGVLISDVEEGGPAAKAGLQRGDVVLSIDGNKMDSTGRLRNLVASAGAGKTVQVEVLREGKKRTFSVLLAKMPSDAGSARRGRLAPESGKLQGLVLENLNEQNRHRFGIEKGVRFGVVVVDIGPNSAAAEAGLRQGDVILEVNRKKVTSVQGFEKLFGTGKGVRLLLVHRNGNSVFLVLRG